MHQNVKHFLQTAIIATLVFVGCFFIFGGIAHRGDRPTSNEKLYAKLQATGTIRSAYAVGAPLLAVDPNTKQKSGLFYELVNSAAGKLGLRVDWSHEVGYGEMIAGLKGDKYDIVGSGVWMNAARGREADFSIPVYYDAVLAFVREGDTRFDKDLKILNSKDYTISTMDGELGESIAKSDFPFARTVALPQNADFSQLIQNVTSGKADVVFLGVAPARQYQAANPGKIREIPSSRPVRLFPVAILLPKGSYELKQSLDAALTEMLNSGEVETLLRKYEKAPGSFLRLMPPIAAEAKE